MSGSYSIRSQLKFAFAKLDVDRQNATAELQLLTELSKLFAGNAQPDLSQFDASSGHNPKTNAEKILLVYANSAPVVTGYLSVLDKKEEREDFIEFFSRLSDPDLLETTSSEAFMDANASPFILQPGAFENNVKTDETISRILDTIDKPQINENGLSVVVDRLASPARQAILMSRLFYRRLWFNSNQPVSNPVESLSAALRETAAYLGDIDAHIVRFFTDVCRAVLNASMAEESDEMDKWKVTKEWMQQILSIVSVFSPNSEVFIEKLYGILLGYMKLSRSLDMKPTATIIKVAEVYRIIDTQNRLTLIEATAAAKFADQDQNNYI